MPQGLHEPGDRGLLCGIVRQGKSAASRCLASWMDEANWIVPARMRCWPGLKLNLHSKGRAVCSGQRRCAWLLLHVSYANAHE